MRTLPWVREDLIAEIKDELWRHLTPAASIEGDLLHAAALLQVTPRELRTLGRLQFLISDEVGELLDALPGLVRRLATTTASEEEWSADRVRGSIQWGRTLAARHATGIPHLYISTPARRAYQTPENELLTVVLDAVVSAGRESGWDRSQSADVGRLISRRVAAAERWRQTRALVEVERRPITAMKLSRIRNGRHRRRYRAAMGAYARFHTLAEKLDRAAIRRAVEAYGLVSRDDPTLFELVCTFRVIKALQELGWDLEKLGLFRGSLRLGGHRRSERLELRYQAAPERLRRQSKYRSVLMRHGIVPGPLRPDLVLTWTTPTGKRWLVIEAKGGSRDVADSARAATFDLLAYRTAFEDVLGPQQTPYGLGVVWGSELEAAPGDDIALCTPDTLTSALASVIRG